MFDVGFSELIVIGLVALIVIGPQRLPTVARTVGHLLGRLQRYVSDVKSDINREMQLDELKKLQEQVVLQAHDMEKQVNEQMNSVESDLNASIAQGVEAKSEPGAIEVAVTEALPAVPPVRPEGSTLGVPIFSEAPVTSPVDKSAA
ncbi:MAG: Sec-independent protein translocase protein TatB [Sulfurisoma sp.]|nr:Sec-independent protein translocase protein TatB [Sulfurisoma sp.]